MTKTRIACLLPLFTLISFFPASAEDLIWTGAVDNQFLLDGNWEGGAPTSDEDVIIIDDG